MALNFSHRHVSEKPMKIADGYLVEGVSEMNGGVFSQSFEKGDSFDYGRNTGGVFSQPWCSGDEKGDCFDYGMSTGGPASGDIVDVLPSDPFGMDMNNTFTAITGWLEDLEFDYSRYGRDEIGDGDHQLFAGLSFIWNNAMRFQEFPESHWFEEGFDGDGSCAGSFVSPTSVDKVMSRVGESSDGGENANVHPALGFCLYHLGVKDLLSVSMVCKSLHTTVCDDSLLWKHIHISQPLNEKINDESLLRLTERAHGTMQCLRLVDCSKITEDCLRKVLERNPQVVKLGVPGCTRISIDGLVSILRDLKSSGKLKVKHLETGGLYGVTKDHYDELLDLLDIGNNVEQTIQKPRYYHRGYTFASCDDVVRALDIEMCRKCQNWRIVYDCPAEDCKGKEECRACSLCVQRCVQCGRCINGVYEETFCLEFLCSGCSKLLKFPLV
ncbi:unnamed protein product [Brassica oleracea var. botrytis]|uniref:F-box domain-containing protein n=3 Tax=Brassica TaxID=3705 RepID=A0ABQ8B432_BRANA|nr:PREDICTED: F-box protein SKIP14-like [Brassica oleracea var. oleracea]XP_022552778.1 F-box protein SKIP14-like [Brassica napus]KAH0899552.1 hypothetical protein HID58_049120 [Brassica napus]VDD26088.1 unnamed protein product [Brassica oleracea]